MKVALQRHQAEACAQTAQISLGNTLENLGSGIIITDRQGSVTFINVVAQKLTGWSSVAAVGIEIDRVFRLIWETDGTPIENPCLRAMRSNEAVKSPDRCWLVAKDKSEIPDFRYGDTDCQARWRSRRGDYRVPRQHLATDY